MASNTSNKRVIHTPGSKPTPKRKRSVAANILLSAEKLGPARKATITSSCKKRLEWSNISDDHPYTKTLSAEKAIDSTGSSCKLASDAILESATRVRERQPCRLSPSEKKRIVDILEEDCSDIVKCLASIPSIWNETKCRILIQLALEKQLLSRQDSVFYRKDCDTLVYDDVFSQIILELKERAPLMLDILSLLFSRPDKQTCKPTASKGYVSSVATVAGMAMHSKDNKASMVQRLYTIAFIRCHADNQLLSRLNKVHLTLASKQTLMKLYESHSDERIIQVIASGKDGKIIGDNLDLRVSTNDTRMKNKARDYHFFASDWTPYRMEKTSLSNNGHVGDPGNINLQTYSPCDQEIQKYKTDLKILIGRELICHFEAFAWMKLFVPKHIPHKYSELMARKSKPLLLPILLRNEAKYEDCIVIMDSYTDQINRWYTLAGRSQELEDLQVPVGGDQLTRVRLEGAKALRAGAHTPAERFQFLQPVIVELFHTQMDFVEKIYKKFLNLKQARDKGTLAQLKLLIDRASVIGNVKSRYAAHEEFVKLVDRACIIEAAMEYFGMDSTSSSPTLHPPPPGIERSHKKKHLAAFEDLMSGFLDFLQGPVTIEDVKKTPQLMKLTVTIGATSLQTISPCSGDVVELKLSMNKKQFIVRIKKDNLLKYPSVAVQIPGCATLICVKHAVGKPDELENYLRNFLQWYFKLVTLSDAIREGDITRVNTALKLMIPYFYSHSPLSKYLVECIDYILKTEVMLSPMMSLQTRCSSFVNMHGGTGKNVAADMEKEHQVKYLKGLIRGLGANKTEDSIRSVCCAGPVILDVVENLDRMTGFQSVKTTHKHRSEEDDLRVVCGQLHQLKPFQTQTGRELRAFKGIKSTIFQDIDRAHFKETVLTISNRLKRSLPVHTVDGPEDLESESESTA